MPRDYRQRGLFTAIEPVTDASRAAAARAVRIGPPGEQLWLDWRADRRSYVVAWYDRSARTGRRVGTGVGAGEGVDPPLAAHQALASEYAARVGRDIPQVAADAGVSIILTRYMAEHCIHTASPATSAYRVQSIERFIASEVGAGRVPGLLTVDQLGRRFVEGFVAFRRREGVSDATIKSEAAALRAAVSWAAESELIASKPHVPKIVSGAARLRTHGRKLVYSLQQLAAILEAARRDSRRHHVHLFVVAMLASHTRAGAILDCDLDSQYQDGVIDWLGPYREQTKKRRSMVPAGPTLASWLEGRRGKLIRYRAPIAARRWADPAVPQFYETPTSSIARSLASCLIEAGAEHPTLKLRVPLIGPDGRQLTRVVRHREGSRFVEREELRWEPVGYPNALRHTIHTQLRRIGVPKAQIDAASGHAEQGTGEHYNHFDAREDLKDFVAGVEQLFDELRRFTTAHVRTHCGPNVFDLGAVRTGKAG